MGKEGKNYTVLFSKTSFMGMFRTGVGGRESDWWLELLASVKDPWLDGELGGSEPDIC